MVSAINEFKGDHPNHLIFGAVSDVHINNTNSTTEARTKKSVNHASFALEKVGVFTGCDFIVHLGDNSEETHIDPTITSSDCGMENAVYAINALKPALERLPSFNLVGNHDKTNDTQNQHDLIGIHNDFDVTASTVIRGFGYKDYTDKKVRVICLNTCDYLNTSGGCALSYEQKDFLMRALDLSAKTNSEEWQILLLSHIPLDWNGGDYNFYSDLQTILKAYEDGTMASITVNSSYAKNETPNNYSTYSGGKLVYDYTGKNSARIIANIHGHVHTNRVSKIANTNIARVATANANPNGNKIESYPTYGDYSISSNEAEIIEKEDGTEKDTSVTFYFIDLDEEVIYSFGYGADIDRTISYGVISPWSETVTNMAVAVRSVWSIPSSGGVPNLVSSNTEVALGVTTANGSAHTDREGETVYVMPVNAKACDAEVTVTDGTTCTYRFIGLKKLGSTYTTVFDTGKKDSVKYSWTAGAIDNILISLERKDGSSWAWGYDDTKIVVTFTNGVSESGDTPSYTNMIDTAGTEDNVRLRSSGGTASASGFASGYFKCKAGDTVRVYFPNGNRSSIPSNGVYICLYSDTNCSLVGYYSTGQTQVTEETDTGYTVKIPSGLTGVEYARVAGAPNGAYTDWVVTVNQEILV